MFFTTAISMLANNISVAGSGCYAKFLGEKVAEPCGVQVGPGANDAVLREPADLPRHVGQNINGIAGDYEYRIRAEFH